MKDPAHRLNEKADARSGAKTQQCDRATADDDHQRRPPADALGRAEVGGAGRHGIPPVAGFESGKTGEPITES